MQMWRCRAKRSSNRSHRCCIGARRDEFSNEGRELLSGWKPLKCMCSANPRPGQGFCGHRLDERRITWGRVEQRRSDIYEIVHALGACEHPAQAGRAIEVTLRSPQRPRHRLARQHFETVGRVEGADRISAGSHSLAAPAMAGHSDQRVAKHLETDFSASAAAIAGAAIAHAAFFTSATIFLAASPRSLAGTIARPELARMSLPN